MLHRSANERYSKLKRVYLRLMKRFCIDDLDEFVQTANSLREWVLGDKTLCREQREHLERFTISESVDWQICRQIANAQKHVQAQSRSKKRPGNPSIPVVTVVAIRLGGEPGFVVPPSRQVVGAGDEVVIEFAGKRESALGFVIRTFRHFHYIFELAPIPIDQRRIPSAEELFGLND